MVGHRELRILQYNVQKSRDVVLASLFQDPKVLEYDILAIQEPWPRALDCAMLTKSDHLVA